MSGVKQEYDPVADSDNLNQKMQIRAVNEARNKVRTVRNNAQEQIASAQGEQRQLAKQGGKRVYLQVVKSYALELAPLISEHDEELWADTVLVESEWTYQPGAKDGGKEIVDVEPAAVHLVVEGVKELLKTEFPVSGRFDVSYRDTAKGEEAIPRMQEWTPSFSQVDMILMQLDESRKALGLFHEGPEEIGVESDEPF